MAPLRPRPPGRSFSARLRTVPAARLLQNGSSSMGQPYVGEIRMFGGNFPPNGWMFCEGQTLPISEYDVLYQLIGTTYGGDGQVTFNLPNLSGRVPVHAGSNGASTYQLGELAGVESVT